VQAEIVQTIHADQSSKVANSPAADNRNEAIRVRDEALENARDSRRRPDLSGMASNVHKRAVEIEKERASIRSAQSGADLWPRPERILRQAVTSNRDGALPAG
jgi:hypothetical protein